MSKKAKKTDPGTYPLDSYQEVIPPGRKRENEAIFTTQFSKDLVLKLRCEVNARGRGRHEVKAEVLVYLEELPKFEEHEPRWVMNEALYKAAHRLFGLSFEEGRKNMYPDILHYCYEPGFEAHVTFNRIVDRPEKLRIDRSELSENYVLTPIAPSERAIRKFREDVHAAIEAGRQEERARKVLARATDFVERVIEASEFVYKGDAEASTQYTDRVAALKASYLAEAKASHQKKGAIVVDGEEEWFNDPVVAVAERYLKERLSKLLQTSCGCLPTLRRSRGQSIKLTDEEKAAILADPPKDYTNKESDDADDQSS